jgi:hypothetical protein
MKSPRILVAAVLLLAGNAHAQTLNKCVSGSGAVSWQSAACGQGTRHVRSLAYTPETVPEVLPASVQVRVNGTRKPRSTRTSGYRSSARPHRAKPDPCRRARERRESTLERVGLKRNFYLLSKLDADVRRVCRY